MDTPKGKRRFVPVFVDRFQSAMYRHVATTLEADGRLVAHFGDGGTGPSIYGSVDEMLAAGERDWRERMREERSETDRAGDEGRDMRATGSDREQASRGAELDTYRNPEAL